MKRTIIAFTIVAIGLLTNKASAQETTTHTVTTVKRTTIGLRGGLNFQNITGKDEAGNKLNNKLKTGFNIGLNAEIPIAPDFYFQPGLLYTTKGAKNIAGTNATLNLNYLELPLNLVYKAPMGSGQSVLVGFGSYLALGVGGSYKAYNTDYKVKFQKDQGTAPNTIYYKPVDAGANLLLGYEFTKKFSAQINAQLGLIDINASNGKTANTGFGVSLGYRF